MADVRHQIEELRQERRKNLRQAHRAHRRSLTAVRPADRRTALSVYRRNQEAAQKNLADIRALRHEWRIHNALVRKLRHRRRVRGSSGSLTWFDGHQCATWIVNDYLVPARKQGVYFKVTSGIRTLATAQYFWDNAARLGLVHYVSVAYPCSSNHCGSVFPKGAVDVFPWNGFRLYIHGHQTSRALRSYHDVLGAGKDDVHYSHTGH